MKTLLLRALLSCLLAQIFVTVSLPVSAMEPTSLNLGPGNSLSLTIDGPIDLAAQSEQTLSPTVVVDSPRGWDQTAPAILSAPKPHPVLRVARPTNNQKKV